MEGAAELRAAELSGIAFLPFLDDDAAAKVLEASNGKVERMLATFADCGMHDLNILRIMNRHFAETLGALAPKPLPLKVRRYAGDLASIGKGEILLTG